MNAEFQMFFNIAITLIGALGGWVLNSLKTNIENLQKADRALTEKIQAVEVLVAGTYVKRDDLDKLSMALFAKLDKIENVLKTDPATVAGINALESNGLLAAGRAAEILA